jgi:hypothetical protein
MRTRASMAISRRKAVARRALRSTSAWALALLLAQGLSTSDVKAQSSASDQSVALRPSLFLRLDPGFLSEPETVLPSYVRAESSDRPRDSDVSDVKRGRLLLAAGLPSLVAGAAMLGTGLGAKCYDEGENPMVSLGLGAAFASIGLGLSIPAIVKLSRAPKAAKDHPRSRREQKRLVRVASVMTALSVAVGVAWPTFEVVACNWS